MKRTLGLLLALAVCVQGEVPAARVASARASNAGAAYGPHLRGGAWTRHENDAPPCGFFAGDAVERQRVTCDFVELLDDERLVGRWGQRQIVKQTLDWHSTSDNKVFSPIEDPRRHAMQDPARVDFSLSKTDLYQLDTVDVTVTLRGLAVHKQDWIGVYCQDDPAEPSPDREYIDWKWVNASTPVAGDSHRVSFGPMVNMRCAWQFRYFAALPGPSKKYTKLGESRLLRFARGDAEPLHVRLSMTTSPTEMRVMWVSSAVADPHVQFGDDPLKLSRRVDAMGDTYDADDMCQEPAATVSAQHFRDPGVIYDAVLTDLRLDRDYYYKVGSGSGGMSRIFKFRVPPPPGVHPAGSVMSFFMYADLGEWTTAATGLSPPIRSGTTLELVLHELQRSGRNYVALMHDGDLSYARGMAYQWDQFGALIEPVASQIPYLVSVGNHEYDYTGGGEKDPSGAGAHNGFHPPEGNYGFDSAGECGVPTNKRFHMPDNGNKVFWYSIEMGLVHHTVISSEHDFTPGSAMHEWLENDLESVDRAKTPWLLLHLHRPIYCSEHYAADNRVSEFLRRHLEPLLAAHRVDAVFSGHFHAFERTCPVLEQQCRSKPWGRAAAGLVQALAPVHIMVGSAGADLDQTAYGNVSWSAARQQEYGYGRVHVHNASHLEFEFQRNRDGALADRAWLISTHDW